MKIALFASAFYPSLGGVEELTRQLAHALKRAGHEAFIVTERWPRTLPEREEFEGLTIYRFPFRTATEGRRSSAIKSAATLALTGSAIRRAIAKTVAQEKADIVHVECVSSNAIYAGAVAKRLSLPFVVSLQGELTMDARQIYQKSERARGLMRSALQHADFLTGCSGQTVREAEDFLGTPFGERGQVVFNGIRLADFEGVAPYSHPRPFILGIGRHVEQKGFDILLQSYARLIEGGDTSTDLILAGDGAHHEWLQEVSASLGLEGRVHFIGRVDRPKAVALFKGCAFFVLPSRHEPMGIVNLEAMAAAKAVIASRVGGVPELVFEGENGLLIPPADIEALESALRRLVRDPQLAARLGANGAERVRAFDWDAIAAQYLDVYARAKKRHSQSL